MKKLMSKIVMALTLLIGVSGQIFSGAQENAAKHTFKEMTVVEKCKAKVGACAQSIKSLVWGNNGWKEHYIRRSFAAVVAIVSGMYGMCAFAGEGIVSRAEDLRGSQGEEVDCDAEYLPFGQVAVSLDQLARFDRDLDDDDEGDDEGEDDDEKEDAAGGVIEVGVRARRDPLMRILGVRRIGPRVRGEDRGQLCRSLFYGWRDAARAGDVQGQLQTFFNTYGRGNGSEAHDLLNNYQIVVERDFRERQTGTLHQFLEGLCRNTNFFRFSIGRVHQAYNVGFWAGIWEFYETQLRK